MTLAQKIATRYDLEPVIPELFGSNDQYNWNQEGLHALGAQCFAASSTSGVRCPTIFAAPPTLASSWNVTLLRDIGDAISTEARAYNNFGGNRGYQNRAVDLNAWLPSINIARDPRCKYT
jgi:beta-glucosidase